MFVWGWKRIFSFLPQPKKEGKKRIYYIGIYRFPILSGLFV